MARGRLWISGWSERAPTSTAPQTRGGAALSGRWRRIPGFYTWADQEIPTAGHVPPDRPPGCTARHVGRPRGARPLHTGPMGPLGPCRAHRLALVASRWVMRTEIGRGGASGPGGPGWGSLLWRCRMTQRTRRGGSWWHLAPQGSPLDHWGGYCAFRGPAIAHTGAQTARVSSVFHRGATRVLKGGKLCHSRGMSPEFVGPAPSTPYHRGSTRSVANDAV